MTAAAEYWHAFGCLPHVVCVLLADSKSDESSKENA